MHLAGSFFVFVSRMSSGCGTPENKNEGAEEKMKKRVLAMLLSMAMTATLLAVFFVPLFFVLVKRLFTRQRPSQE